MKHFISLIFSIFFSFLIFPAAFAQDVTDDWSGLIKDYSSNSNFGKIISEQEYNKAIQTKESFIKKNLEEMKKSISKTKKRKSGIKQFIRALIRSFARNQNRKRK